MAFVPVVAVLVAVTLLYVAWSRERYELRRVRLDLTGTAGRIVATRDQREMVVAFSVFYLFVGGLTNFFPTLLVEGGFSETVAGALLVSVALLGRQHWRD